MAEFSIVIPCFNAGKTLPATLASITAQTVTDWEAICVDDGSADNTVALIRAAAQQDPRIRLTHNPGKGPSEARNIGALDFARGKIIAFCDADDMWTPDKLAHLQTAFADENVAAAYGKVGFFRKDPSDAKVFSTVPPGNLSIEILLGENPVCTMSNLAIRRKAFASTGGFDPAMVHNEDLELLIRLVGQGARVRGIQSLLTWYRSSNAGLSSDLSLMLEGRARALATAARYGVAPSPACHAVHHRYLARRALRLGQGRFTALRYAITGLRYSPAGFLRPLRRGGLTLIGALCATVLPSGLSRKLFSR